MAESIFTTLANGSTKTSVPAMGKDEDGKTVRVEHTLPEHLFPSAEIFADEDALIDWANNYGYTYALLQRGISDLLIEVRARFKHVKKDDIWKPEYGQANIDKMQIKPMKRPESAMSAEEKAEKALAKLSPKQLKELLAKIS